MNFMNTWLLKLILEVCCHSVRFLVRHGGILTNQKPVGKSQRELRIAWIFLIQETLSVLLSNSNGFL